MKSFSEIGTEIGELVERKNAAYGSSFAKCGAYLRLLYPDGVRPDQYEDVLLLARDFDKSMRIATDRDALGENPYRDKAGYAILGVHLHQEKEESNPCGSSANGPDAAHSSKDQADGAVQSTSPSSMPPTSASGGQEASPQPDGCSLPLESVAAPSATEAASPDAAARRASLEHSRTTWLHRHHSMKCIACEEECRYDPRFAVPIREGATPPVGLRACSATCKTFCNLKLSLDQVEGVQRL